MSKFDNVIAEAAYVISLNGFNEEEYGEVSTTGWNGLVTVSATTLLNVGAESDLVDRFRTEVPGVAGALVWIREDDQGFVHLVEWGTDEGMTSGTDTVNRKWDEYVAEMDRKTEEAENNADGWVF